MLVSERRSPLSTGQGNKAPLKLAILTNARASDQRSMIGYGELLLETANSSGCRVVEFRAASLFGWLLPERVQGLPRKLANNLDRFLITPLMLAGRRADIVHVVDPGNVIYLPLIRHHRSIATVHDMIPYLARDGKLPGWRPSPTGRWLMNRITERLAKVDHIICVSQATSRDLLSYVDIPEGRIRVIHNAVFQPMGPASPEACADLRTRLRLPKDAPLILHVGRNFYKNRQTVIEVAAKIRASNPNVHLVMVGTLTSDLTQLVDRLGLTDALHVLPYVRHEDMAVLHSTATVLLFPSLYEGFGLPVLEAQMCGTPVVCSNAGALPEVALPDCPLADPHDSQTLYELTRSILAWQNRHPVSDRDALHLSQFSVRSWTNSYLGLYQTVQQSMQIHG